MGKRNPTTVHLTEIAQKILDTESPSFGGIKPVLSGSLVAFAKLPPNGQKEVIKEAKAGGKKVEHPQDIKTKTPYLTEEQLYRLMCFWTKFEPAQEGRKKRQQLLKSIKASTTLPDGHKKQLRLLFRQFGEALRDKKQTPLADFLELWQSPEEDIPSES